MRESLTVGGVKTNSYDPGTLLKYRAYTDISCNQLDVLTLLLREHYRSRRGPNPKLKFRPFPKMTLVHLREGTPSYKLAKGFGLSTTQAHAQITTAIRLLGTQTVSLEDIDFDMYSYLVVDGTLIRTCRRRSVSSLYSGKHKDHGVNIQALIDPYGHIIWAGKSVVGSTHDMKSARSCGLFKHLKMVKILVLGDKGYIGANIETGGTVVTPFEGKLTPVEEDCNKAYAGLRSPGERGFARLKLGKL